MAGISEREFWEMSPRYFDACVRATDRREQVQYEVARYSAWLTIGSQMPKGSNLSISQLGAFPWEKRKDKVEEISYEEFMQRSAALDAAFKKTNGISGT